MTPEAAQKLEELSPKVWLERISSPLAGAVCGEDPRYGEDFGTIRQEINKLKGNDFAKIEALCIEILSNQSKDLRVAGYLLLAATYTSGINGLIDAVRAYQVLLDGFGKGCHPQKESQRLTTLDWLNNPKLESYARQKLDQAGAEQLNELRTLIDSVNEGIATAYGDGAPRWTSLDPALDKALQNISAKPTAMEPEAIAQAPTVAVPTTQSQSPEASFAAPAAIDSERELLAATRAIRDYLLRSNDFMRAIAYTRALRWGALQLPPHENGKTRIPAPRQTALNELQQLGSANAPEALLTLCENLFLEGGGHLLLDLQRTAFEAAQALGRSDLAEFIAEQSVSLLRRLPELPGLQFENGHPFADMTTHSWIEERLAAAAPGREAKEPGTWEEELAALLGKGRQLLRNKQLPTALGLFEECPLHNEKQRLQLQLAKARLCLEGGRAEIGLPIIEDLAEQIERQSLSIWEPSLAIDIWKQQLEASQACLKKASGEEKLLLATAISRLKRKICSTDPAAAARLL